MRLKQLTIAGFRGFPRDIAFDLDADAVIVSGVNGSGKTSMLDAILWALTGSIERLHEDEQEFVSKYSTSGEARVELTLSRDDSSTLSIARRFDGVTHLSVDAGTAGSASGSAAEALLLDALWPDAKVASEPWDALSRSLTRATYLQQDAIREFVEVDEDQDRFRIVAELVGVGRVSELQRQLEASRNSWSRATSTLARELEPLQARRASFLDRLERLGRTKWADEEEREFSAWLGMVRQILGADFREEEARGAQGLDRTLTRLQVREHQEIRRAADLQRLLDHIETPVPDEVPIEPLQEAVQGAEIRAAQAAEHVAAVQAAAAEQRRRQVQLREHAESRRALAQLALHHLGDACPVCGQDYDHDATRSRLEELAMGEALAGGEEEEVVEVDVEAAAVEREAAERDMASARAALQWAEDNLRKRTAWEGTLAELARGANLDVSADLEDRARELLVSAQSLAESIRRLRERGDKLALQLARASELAQRAEVEEQLATLDEDLAVREAEVAARSETWETTTNVLNALRVASDMLVAAELRRVEPLLQRIYATMDPHPSFRAVNFLTRTFRGRGRLWTSVRDHAADVSVSEPSIVLSSSQLNVLALSTFLALNLGIETLPLKLVALDDPLQSLDTVNLLGLADLLRRVMATRQVVISTHDERLSQLLVRKLRPVTSEQRARAIYLKAWTREGPTVAQETIPQELRPLRLAAS